MLQAMDRSTSLYQGASGQKYHDEKREVRPEALEWLLRFRARKLQPHVGPGDVVFEMGVGSGWNLGRLRCLRRMGCDVSEFLAPRLGALGIEFVRDMAAVPGGIADVAICHHALEHVLRPAEALGELGRILKPGGKLVLHVPWEKERRYAHYRRDEPNHHLYTWNAQNLGNLVASLDYGIESVAVRRYGYDRLAANLACRLRLGEAGFRSLRSMLVAVRPLSEVELIARRGPAA
jgi:SAM-dependent methyltransferase